MQCTIPPWRFPAWIAAICSGALIFLGYAGFDLFYLEWLSLVPLLWATRDQQPVRAFFLGWTTGIVAHIGGFYWVTGMFRQFAGAPLPLALAGLLLLAAANGFVVAAWSWGTRLVTRDTGWSVVWVAPVIWTAVESFWPVMFPNYIGASQYRLSHLTQIADLAGIHGVSFLVVFCNATLYSVITSLIEKSRSALRPALIFAAILAATLAYGEYRIRDVEQRMRSAETMTVGLVQTNRGAGSKRSDPESLLREHQEMSRSLVANAHLDLIVWPESVCFMSRPEVGEQLPSGLLGDPRVPALIGAVTRLSFDVPPYLYNSALLTGHDGRILGVYDKMTLVPFGEYIPFGESFPRLYSFLPHTGRFRAGTNREPLQLGDRRISVNICYEDIFPERIRSLMNGGNPQYPPQLMFNLTNDSWYGNSTEPLEHLALASFRSIEHHRSLVRATNTGISAFVDPLGRVVSRSGVWARETLISRVPLMSERSLYARLGNWIGWGCAALSLAAIGRALRAARLRKTS